MIDKPAGLVVHPAPGHWDDTLVNALVARGTTLARRRRAGPARHRAPARPRHLRAHAGGQDRPGASAARRRDRRAPGAADLRGAGLGTSRPSPHRHRGADRRGTRGPEAHGGARRRPRGADRRWVVARLRRRATCSGSSSTPGGPTRSGCTCEHVGHPVVGDPVYAGGGSRRISGAARRAAERAGARHAAAGASRGRLWHSAIP